MADNQAETLTESSLAINKIFW